MLGLIVPLLQCFVKREAKGLARLRICADSPEPSLLADAMLTKFSYAGLYTSHSIFLGIEPHTGESVYAQARLTGESANAQASLSLRCSQIRCVPNFRMQAYIHVIRFFFLGIEPHIGESIYAKAPLNCTSSLSLICSEMRWYQNLVCRPIYMLLVFF